MKQTLSVADFAIILDLLNEKISDMERPLFFERCVKEDKIIEDRLTKLKSNPYYQSLLHLKESLQNLSIEVETPKVEIKNGRGG